MEQYQYVEGLQRFHPGLRLRCAACLSLQVLLFEHIHYDIQHSFCIPSEKVVGAFHLGKKPGNFGGSKSGIPDW